MEIARKIKEYGNPTSRLQPSNDNTITHISMGRSFFPDGTVAHIYRPSRSAGTAGQSRWKRWRLVFDRRSAPFIEPLMGYTGTDDTLAQIELEFPDLESATRYARQQGLAYVVRSTADRSPQPAAVSHQVSRASHAFSDATLERLGLAQLQESYGFALDGAAGRDDPSGPESWSSPMDVVLAPRLTLAAKRSILMNWAWTEYLIDQASNESMPENNRPSRLDEVEQALLALERYVENCRASTLMDRKTA